MKHRLRTEAHSTVDQFRHFGSAQVRRHHDEALGQIDTAVIAEREAGFVEDAQQQLPQRVGSLFDFVEQDDRELQLFCVPLVESFLRQQGMSFAMAQIAGRGTNQLRDFMRVLKLGAIDLDARASVSEEGFGRRIRPRGFYRSRSDPEKSGCRPDGLADSIPPGTSDKSQ